MIQDIDNINVSIQSDDSINVTIDNDSISVSEAAPTDIAEIMHNEEIRQENEAQRIANEEQRISNEQAREDYIDDLKQRVLDGEFNGEDGYSPTANVVKSGSTSTITITDKNGTTTAEVLDGTNGIDGKDGADGKDGQDGADGYSPSASVSKSGDTATITITDKNGTTTASISDGQNGQDGEDGADGFSPSATVTKSGSVATITITDKDGTTTANIYDGTGAGGIWGSITGTLSDQTDLQNALNLKQDIMQYTTMPSATSSNAGQVAQYIGDPDANFRQWSFYLVKETSPGSGTYHWVQLQVDDLSDYQIKIDSSHKLSADLIDDSSSTNKFFDGLTILSYGNSTWNDFINAYNNNEIVYCRASSNANPATGSQTRLAFMAYVNNATSPTNVEFQYYRSVSSHSATQQGDQVFVYKLTNSSGGTWSVETREAMANIDASGGLTRSYSGNKLTIDGSTKQDVIDSSHKLDADLVDDSTATNKFVTATDKTTWNSKSDYIPELTPLTLGTQDNPIILEDLKPGNYYNPSNNSTTDTRYVKLTSNHTTITFYGNGNVIIVIPKKIIVEELQNNEVVFYVEKYGEIGNGVAGKTNLKYVYDTENLNIKTAGTYSVPLLGAVWTGSNQIISGTKTFSNLPQSSATPSNNNDLVNKKYVDDSIPDVSNFISTSVTAGLIKNDGTIDTTSYSTFSGSYTDLSNKPSLSAVATSGSYSDLSNKPTIPEIKTSKTTSDTAGYSCTYVNNQLSDTGWVDLTSYINTTYFKARPGYPPKIRKVGNAVYFTGFIVCKSAVGSNVGKILNAIPSQYRPTTEMTSGGVRFSTNNAYSIFISSNGEINVAEGSNITVQQEYSGYALGCLTYLVN